MDGIIDDTEHPAAPPARVAARLQRRSCSRRRSSAQSSRRSSISSLHSRASSLSCHGGPYSTHIAQHLRRASIIESRKARLAQRAEHAEQVRLRAAAAKAAPRASNCEEKALAAQAAREKLLAEITARCEEEVRRAKRIAEETREKKAAEHARLEAQLAVKSADVARRKSNYQLNSRRPRTTSLAAVEEKKIEPTQLRKLSQNAAVKVIQRAWRRSRPQRLAHAFINVGITTEQLAQQDFEDVTTLIDMEEAIISTMRFVQYLGLLDHETDENARRGAVRVFLSAYLIVAHPEQAFSHGGKEPQEEELKTKGQALTGAIDGIVKSIFQNTDMAYPREALQLLFREFTSGFHAWKTQDLGILSDVLVGSFVNFDLILQSARDGGFPEVHEEYQQAIRTEQTKILVKLKRLLGHERTMTRLRKAVKKARSEKTGQATSIANTNIPRVTTPVRMEVDTAVTALSTPPATPIHETEKSESMEAYIDRLARTMTILPSNREISHEIQINRTFDLQQTPWTKNRDKFVSALRSAMRDSLKSESSNTEANWAYSMVALIKSKVLHLMVQKHPLYHTLDGFLDPKLIQQQVANVIFSFKDFFVTLVGMLKRLCSQGRDDLLNSFLEDQESDTVDSLFNIINILDLMILDHVNFQFRLATPQVLAHGHEHEAAAFADDLQMGRHRLETTRTWWNAGHAAAGSSTARGTPAHANAIYARALTDLLFSNSPVTYKQFPETLHLDFFRLLRIRAKTFQIVAVASILLTSKIRLRRNRDALWTQEADRLMKLEFKSTDAALIVRQIESGHMMPDSTRSGLLDFASRVLPTVVAASEQLEMAQKEHDAAVQEGCSYRPHLGRSPADDNALFNEQIATFLLKSLKEYFFTRVAATTTADRVRVASDATARLTHTGMPEFVTAAGAIVDELQNIKNVDLKAHEKWYGLIADEANQIDTDMVAAV